MDEYIERKKLEEAFDNADPDVCESDLDGHSDWGFGRENVRDVIRGVPAADVAPVVHGYFVYDEPRLAGGVDWGHCSNCGSLAFGAETRFDYCPWCGARMDGDGNAFD